MPAAVRKAQWFFVCSPFCVMSEVVVPKERCCKMLSETLYDSALKGNAARCL
jgi:hypothetical protein